MKLTLTTVPSECSSGTKKPFSPSGSAIIHLLPCHSDTGTAPPSNRSTIIGPIW